MKVINWTKIRIVLVGFLAAIVLGGGSAKADFTIGEYAILGPTLNKEGFPRGYRFSSDGLELYISIARGSNSMQDIWVSKRDTLNSPWQEPVNLGPNINISSTDEYYPAISPDGLELYFVHGKFIHVSTRPSKDAPWSNMVPLGTPVNSDYAVSPEFSADGLTLYFGSNRPGGSGDYDIWVTTRASKADPWSEPVNLGPNVNSSSQEYTPSISTDGRVLFFDSNRSGRWEIWMVKRRSKYVDWSQPVNISTSINVPGDQYDPEVSPNGSTLYFTANPTTANGSAAWDLLEVPIIPIVDFNGDEAIDLLDIVTMTNHWGENYPPCDIGPTPLGDCIVDIQDLIVLTEYIEPIDCTLIAYLALDETEGLFAIDSAGGNDAFVVGGASWQPNSGQLNGALQLDGVSGCVITGIAPNPADGPFSIFAWIKGGAPGQVVVSQMGGANWLCIDSSDGVLMTELAGPGSNSGPLLSQTIITDGAWHRIGFVWDGSHRMLYVDNVVVAEDVQDGLEGSANSLYIGTGKTMQPGTYFSGMIDDIRIYDRALTTEQIAALAQ